MAIDPTQLVSVKITWPANAELDITDFELFVPADLAGRVDIWKVPVCTAYPQGYFVAISKDEDSFAVEPGCRDWEKKLLAKISFAGIPNSREEIGENKIVYLDEHLFIDPDVLNPNDYNSMFPEEEQGEGE